MTAPAPPVCVVGAGRLARALSARLAADLEIVAVSRRSGYLPRPMGRPDLPVSDDPAEAGSAQVVLMAVPATAADAALSWLVAHLRPDALIANTATEVETPRLAARFPSARIVGCKIVGQAGAIERGARPVFVLSGTAPAEAAVLTHILGPIGEVIEGDEQVVAELNRLVATRVVRMQRVLEADLRLQGLVEPLVVAGSGAMAAGVWRALADDDAGPFLRSIVNSVATEWGVTCGEPAP